MNALWGTTRGVLICENYVLIIVSIRKYDIISTGYERRRKGLVLWRMGGRERGFLGYG